MVGWRGIALCAALLLVSVGCERSRPGGPAEDGLPPGAWLYGDAQALRRALDAVAGLHGTGAARAAQQARAQVAACVEIISHADDPAELLTELRCVEGAAQVPDALRRLRGADSLAWLVRPRVEPTSVSRELPPLRGTARVSPDGAIDASLSFSSKPGRGLARLLVPSERGAGRTRLASQDSLIHARLRPAGGLDVASQIAPGGQGDRLFQLTSTLFAGAALAGTWELAVYLPQPSQALPSVALGLELALPELARAGVDRLVADLEATWPIRHREARFDLGAGGEVRGACFFELRILPEFAPCWAIERDLLTVGWNARSLQRALGASSAPPAPLDGMVLALDRWPAAERALGGEAGDYPWQRIEVAASSGGDEVVLSLRALARSLP